jgi:hypothetical protein
VVGSKDRLGITAYEDQQTHLNIANAEQRQWVAFLVWRKWMMVFGAVVSLTIVAVCSEDFMDKDAAAQDVEKRCESAMAIPLDPTTAMQDLWKVRPSEFTVNSWKGEEYAPDLTISEPVGFAQCQWAPFAEWKTESPESTTNVTTGSMGCNAVTKMQYRQPRQCLCSLSTSAYSSYAFVDMETSTLKSGQTGELRSIVGFNKVSYCQKPPAINRTRLNAAAASGGGEGDPGNPCTLIVNNKSTRGVFGKVAGAATCFVSKDGGKYFDGTKVNKANTLFPPVESRQCCGASEFLFQHAVATKGKWTLMRMQWGVKILGALVNLCMSVAAARTWNSWGTSSKFTLLSFIIPFCLSFIIFTVPDSAAAGISHTEVGAKLTGMLRTFVRIQMRLTVLV